MLKALLMCMPTKTHVKQVGWSQRDSREVMHPCITCYHGLLPSFALVQAEVDFAGLAARLRDGEGRAAETDRAAREGLHRCAQTEAQLQSTEVCWHFLCCPG